MNVDSIVSRTTLRASADFYRIAGLPRRAWDDRTMEQCTDYWTAKLRTPSGTMRLRPLQAVALHEIATCRGLVAALRVGGGKTLLSLLAPAMVAARRPILLLPAALIDKTRVEMSRLMLHWQIPRHIQMQSYETLGRENAADWLEKSAPDMIIADEVHRLKNDRAGVTRRVTRYMRARPSTVFVAMSGTMYRDDIEDFAHIAVWSLKDNAPVPMEPGELSEWSECLSRKTNPLRQVNPGPLLTLAAAEDYDNDPQVMARKAFRRRLQDTPGYIASPSTEDVTCSIMLRGITYKPNVATETNFSTLRNAWETPDGWQLCDAVSVWRCARQLALGMHYIWQPRPPAEWMEARKGWGKYVRQILSRSRTLDTELQVRHAVDGGALPEGAHFLQEWHRHAPLFEINSVPVWHDDTVLKLCAKWAKEGPGIIWTEHSFFAHALSRLTGLDYYGEQGVNARGEPIENANPKHTVIASIQANSAGRNLQAWNRNLVTSPPSGQDTWQQMIGRTHRYGQAADTISVDVLIGCREHFDALNRAIEAARVSVQTMGDSHKLLLADIVIPTEQDAREFARQSKRWDKSIDGGGVYDD